MGDNVILSMGLIKTEDGMAANGPLATEAGQAAILAGLDYVVTAAYTATIGATSIIPTAFAATLPANTVRIVLIPRGAVYYKVGDVASAATALVPLGGLAMPVTKTLADTIQIFAGTIVCDLLVCTPR